MTHDTKFIVVAGRLGEGFKFFGAWDLRTDALVWATRHVKIPYTIEELDEVSH